MRTEQMKGKSRENGKTSLEIKTHLRRSKGEDMRNCT